MIRTTCTAFKADGVTPCREVDECTRVEVRNLAGTVLYSRFVCPSCRKRMKLPDFDCYLTPRNSRGVRL